VINTFDLAANA